MERTQLASLREAQLLTSLLFRIPSAWLFPLGPASCCYPYTTKLDSWYTCEVFVSGSSCLC